MINEYPSPDKNPKLLKLVLEKYSNNQPFEVFDLNKKSDRARHYVKINSLKSNFAKWAWRNKIFYGNYASYLVSAGIYHSPLNEKSYNFRKLPRLFKKIFFKIYTEKVSEILNKNGIKCEVYSYVPIIVGSQSEHEKKVIKFFSSLEKEKGYLPSGEYQINGVTHFVKKQKK